RLLARLGWLLVIVVAKLAMWSMHSKERVLVAVVSAGFGFLLLLFLLQEIALLIAALLREIRDALLAIIQAPLHPLSLLTFAVANQFHLALVLTLLALVAIFIARLICTELTLRSRISYAVLPASDFDPGQAHIQSFAAHLSSMRRRRLAWLDRAASAFRVRLTTTGEMPSDGERKPATGRQPIRSGLPLMIWEFPARFKPLLSIVTSCYPAVELVPLAEFPAPPCGPLPQPSHRVCLELEPASEFYPLKSLPYPSTERSGVDPLQSMAASLAKGAAGGNDRLEVAVDFLPLAPIEAMRVRRSLLAKANKLDIRRRDQKQASDTAEKLQQRLHHQGLFEKVGPAQLLFGLQLLIKAEAACEGKSWRSFIPGVCCCCGEARARSMAARAQASFEQFSGANYFRAKGISFFGLLNLGAGLPAAQQWFEHRFQRGLVG
ncbi:MAG: hypothetical protein ACREP9_20700, partial [Candidatus Dormibacteraceae bacterium]